MNSRSTSTALFVATAIAFPLAVLGSPVGKLPTFSPGQPIRAADFNSAFGAFKDAIDDNHTRIGNLGALQTTSKTDLVSAVNEVHGRVPTLEARVAALENTMTTLQDRVTTLEARRQFMTFSPTTLGDIIAGPSSGANVDVVLRQFDGLRHEGTVHGDYNAIQAFADAPGVITIAATTLDASRNLGTIPTGGDLALDVVVHYSDSIGDTYLTATTLVLPIASGALGTLQYTLSLPSLRALAPANSTSLNEITLTLNAAQSTLPAGGIGSIRCTAFVPLSQ